MLPPSSLEIARQTLLILVPELLILLVATAMMTAGAFVRFPRRLWCGIATGTMLAALLILFGLRHQTIDVYSAIALNDAFSYNARLVLILAGSSCWPWLMTRSMMPECPNSSAPS